MAIDPWGTSGGYMSEDQFRAAMDATFGRGKWRETGGWRSQAREEQLRAQGAQTVRPGAISAHSVGTAEAPGAHDIVVDGLTPAQAAAKLKAAGLPTDQVLPEGEAGSQGPHLHVGLAAGADPWGSAGDPWGSPPAAVQQQHYGVLDEATRLWGALSGGAVSGAGKVIKGLGELADIYGHAQLGTAGATGVMVDPATGQAIKVPEALRPALTAAARQPLVTPTTNRIGGKIDQWGDDLAPKDRNTAESIVHGAGEMAAPLVAAAIDPALGGAAFAAQGTQSTEAEAQAAGADPQTAEAAGLEGGAVQGVLGMVPAGHVVEGLARPIVKGIEGRVLPFVGRLAAAGSGNAVLGGAMQTGENVVAAQNYDPNRPWYQNVPESAASMAVGGAAIHSGGEAAGALVRRLRPAEAPVQTEAPAGTGPDDLAAQMPAAQAAHAYAQNSAHLADARTPDEVPVTPVEPPAPYEAARVAEGAPVHEMAPAIADVEEMRGAAPKGYSLFSAMRDLGGLRTKTPDGQPIGDAADLLRDARRPGLVNNKTGLDPDTMREALQERGWFGVQEGEGERRGDNVNDLYGLIDQEARGTKVYHPEDVAPQAILRRVELEHEFSQAGIAQGDSTEVAAAKLAAYRANIGRERGIGMTLLRDRAKALGLDHGPDRSYDDLLGDVIEREAIQGEYDGAQADEHERILDAQLTPEEHEWLSRAGGSGDGERATAEPSEETGWEPASEPGAEGGDREPGPGPEGDPWGSQALPEPHQLGPSERQHLGGETVDQNVMPGTEQSARQAAAAREGAIKAKVDQKDAGELFEPKAPDQGDLKLRRGPDFTADAKLLARGLEGVAPDAISEKAQAKLIKDVAEVLAKIAPTATSRPMRALREPAGNRIEAAAWRQGARHIIAWSLDTPDAVGAARHEAVHALRSQGLFRPQEWSALSAEAMDAGWMDRYRIAERYPDLTHEGQLEEAIAERFADWRRDRQAFLPPFVRELFRRVEMALRQVAVAAKKVFGKDAAAAADVFARMESGDVGRRGLETMARAPTGDLAPAFQREREGPEISRRELLSAGAAGAALLPERALGAARTDLKGNTKVQEAFRSGRLADVVRAIKETTGDPAYREIARILDAGGLGKAKIRVEPMPEDGALAGVTDSTTGDVTLYRSARSADNGFSEETALHEALHSYLAQRYFQLGVYGLKENRAKMGVTQHGDVFVDRFVHDIWKPWSEMMDAKHPEMIDTTGTYDGGYHVWAGEAHDSPDELFVRALTDPDLQHFLKTTDMKGDAVEYRDPDSWWNRIVDFFAKLLGVPVKDQSAFGQIMDAANGVLKSAALDRPTGAVAQEVARRNQLQDRVSFQRNAPSDAAEAEKRRSFVNKTLGEGVDAIGSRLKKTADRAIPDPVHELLDSARMGVSPLSMGSERAKATAKDFANTMRETAWEWNRIDGWLDKTFTPEQRKRMWEAADEESVLLQKGQRPYGDQGLNRLPPQERAVVEELQKRANDAFTRAKALGMTNADPLPSYVPRMVVEMTAEGAQRPKGKGPATSGRTGRNLSTTTGQLRHREHLTAEETEAAAKAGIGEGATVVRDIRTLGLATGRLEQAIAGRTLVEKIKQIGKSVGEETVAEGASPDPQGFFTIDHPALKTWGPKFVVDHESGKVSTIDGPDGKPVMEAKPLYIAKEFEGPLKAVLQTPTGPIYNGLMQMKGKALGIIMYSPVMHNAVIWGKAIPAAPRQVLTFEIYRRGNAARNDPQTMREAIQAGLDPIGRRYFNQDITAIAEGPQIAPGRSWTAKLIGGVPALFDKNAGDATKRAIDKLGDVWHNTFLWDRVADLQMGLYKSIRDAEIKKGLDPQSAQRLAAHFANRYAGALPIEGMSKLARQTANIVLFSRSFTLGNLGAYKDIVRGLPGEVQAQVKRDSGVESLNHVQGEARRKAIAMLALDIGLSYAGLWLGAQATAWVGHHAFQAPGDNEPGKEKRFLIRTQPDGTAVYGRLPTGKVGEELTDWASEPMETLKRKLSPFARLMYEVAANDKGFGKKLYDPYDKTPAGLAKNTGRVIWAAMQSLVPLGQLQGAETLAGGPGDKTTAALQTFLPAAGITVSKGAPGGPQMADVYAAKDRQEFAVQEALPGIMQQVRAGDVPGARKALAELGVAPGLINYYIRVARNPQARLSGRKVQDFRRMATPEERARFARDRLAAAQEREPQ